MLREALPAPYRARVRVLPSAPTITTKPFGCKRCRQAWRNTRRPGARIALVGHFERRHQQLPAGFPGLDPHRSDPARARWTPPPSATRTSAPHPTPWAKPRRLGRARFPASTIATLQQFAHTSTIQLCKKNGACCAATATPGPGALPAGVCDGGRGAALPGPCAADSPCPARPARASWQCPAASLSSAKPCGNRACCELAEETHCDVPEATLRAALQSVAVFDHPDRSQRGRTITHAHYFDLGDAPFPVVQADDDASTGRSGSQWSNCSTGSRVLRRPLPHA